MTDRIVLAYAGDVETSAAIPSLAEERGAEVVTLTLDFGQGRDLEEIRDRALAAGAARAHVLDVREEFARDFVLPALQAGALREGRDPMAAALARPLMRKKLTEVAAIEGAQDVIDRSTIDASLWGRQGSRYTLTKSPAAAPETPACVEISFERGVPAAINGVAMGLTELIESLSIIAGHHGVGRIEMADMCSEAPAAIVLHAAHAALESSVLPRAIKRLKDDRATEYVHLVWNGLWFTAERETMDALNAKVQDRVTGSVRIRLFKGALVTPEVAAADQAAVPRT